MVKSTIKEISIYRNSCFIKREGKVKLNKGKQSVVLDNLPETVDVNTLSLALPENVKGSNVQVEPLDDKAKEELLEDINKQINDVQNKIEIKNYQIEIYNKNADFSNKENISFNEITEYIDNLPKRLEKIYEEINELEKKKKNLYEQLNEKEKEANLYLVKADIEVDKEIECPFVLTYNDSRAYWLPVYEIHTLENNEISLLLKAKVKQWIDEDLSDVKVSLLTGNPSVSKDIPTLNPVYVDFYSPATNLAGMKMMQANRAVAMEDTVCYEEAQPEMVQVRDVSSSVKKEDTMTNYELTGLWNLKNNNEIMVDLDEKKIPCKYHVIAIPKKDNCGYLAAEVLINDIQDFVVGSALVYHNNTYVGEVYLSFDSDKETYDISLGKDETIKLKRNQKKKFTSNVILKGQKKTEYEYELKVNSLKDKKVLVTMIDQIPVSNDKSIVVDKKNVSGGKLDEDTGKIIWQFELEPSENKNFNLAYDVSWPKDKRINI